jgi:hypothetical protein
MLRALLNAPDYPAIVPSRPHPTHNLISVFDLQAIQKKVARRDPVTGEKINPLRKSYANKVKFLGLEGKNKAQPNNGELEGLVEPGWNMDVGDGVTMWDQRWQDFRLDDEKPKEDILSKLESALKMEPGRLPKQEHAEWKNTLGLDDVAAAVAAAATTTKPAAAAVAAKPLPGNLHLAHTAPAMAARNSAPSSPRNAIRPDRTGKKRRYNDSSFEGYNDGYDEDGYNTGGVDENGRRRDASSKRQKRKVSVKNAGFHVSEAAEQ